MTDLLPVILSGGSGTRLWPLSRSAYPKQFLPLVGDDTMLQATAKRVAGLTERAPLVVSNNDHRFMVAEQLREINQPADAILLEPVGRNTAPAIALAALHATQDGQDAVLLVLPSDHVIQNIDVFHERARIAHKAAETGKLITFGIVPTAPETGYGYIQSTSSDQPQAVKSFVEKPDLDTAKQYLASGDYFWNSGMFMFLASAYLKQLETYQPKMLAACQDAFNQAKKDIDFVRVDAEAFTACPSDSIDYAVMEHTPDVAMISLDAGWSDVGSWSALWEICDQDEQGNAHHGDVIAIDCKNTYAHSDKLVAMIGLDDVVVVDTDDAIMVGHRHHMQKIKQVVGEIKQSDRTHAVWHRKVYRPWGAYDSIDSGERFQVKRITVKPGGTLSLQMHHHRAEHWIVVSGTAKVTKGDEAILLTENQSTYIPLGVTHRLENPGKLPLELIEVQSGSYLGEDDIVRFEDQYGRK